METVKFGTYELPRAQYDRISRAHEELFAAIARAGEGPLAAAKTASWGYWRELGSGHAWSSAELREEQRRMEAAQLSHPDYEEWRRLSDEADRRIERNRALRRPLLAYSDADWNGP